jgi:hypothetical protein
MSEENLPQIAQINVEKGGLFLTFFKLSALISVIPA